MNRHASSIARSLPIRQQAIKRRLLCLLKRPDGEKARIQDHYLAILVLTVWFREQPRHWGTIKAWLIGMHLRPKSHIVAQATVSRSGDLRIFVCVFCYFLLVSVFMSVVPRRFLASLVLCSFQPCSLPSRLTLSLIIEQLIFHLSLSQQWSES